MMNGSDVEFHSLCHDYVLLSLVNKEAALACGRIELGGKTKLNAGRKKAESRRSLVTTTGDRHWMEPHH